MTTFLLIRHADNDYVGHTLAGWTPGVHLNQKGREQAARLAERLAQAGVAAIYSSPLERARETAEPLARRLGLTFECREDIGEIGTGEWTGRTLAELENDPRWKRFNAQRAVARIPGGESMLEVQQRMLGALEELRARHPGQVVAIVSHGDPIRGILMHLLGMPLDFIERLEVGTASVSVVELHDWGPRVLRINDRCEVE